MDDIELRSVQLQFTNSRGSLGGINDVRRVATDRGEILVAVQGDTTKPAILTYHDLGLNCKFNKYICKFLCSFMIGSRAINITSQIKKSCYSLFSNIFPKKL